MHTIRFERRLRPRYRVKFGWLYRDFRHQEDADGFRDDLIEAFTAARVPVDVQVRSI